MSITPSPADRGMTAAIVTGASQGIGASEAEHLVMSGRLVVINDIDVALLEETARRLGGTGIVKAVPGDISQTDTAKALIAAATEDGHRLDVVINNAGTIANGMIYDITDEAFDRVLAVNLRGTYMLSREAAKHWRDRAAGSEEPTRATLLNTTSRAALLANPGQSNYAASKAGVVVLTQALARELGGFGVRCNVIAPRAYTKMMRDGVGEFDPAALEDWSPDHIGRFAAFLCGPGGAGITGQIFVVHGPRVQLCRTWTVSDPIEIDYAGGEPGVKSRVEALFAGEPTAIQPFQVDDLPLASPPSRSPFQVETAVAPPATMS